MQLPRPTSVENLLSGVSQMADALENLLNGRLTGANIAANSISLGDLEAVAFTVYTPAWTSTGTAPSLGNGAIVGRYTQVGKLCFCSVVLLPGSTTTFGTGVYSFSLPINAAISGRYTGDGYAFDTSAGFTYGLISIVRTSTLDAINTAVSATQVSNVSPFTWANGDSFTANVIYESV